MKKQSGSAHVIIVIILVVALIGALGFIFWQNFVAKKADTKTSSEETSKPAAKEEPKKEPTLSANWFVYESQNKKYSMAIPDGWRLRTLQGNDDLFLRAGLTYSAGTPAVVEAVEDYGSDGGAFSLNYDYKSDPNFSSSDWFTEADKLETYTTKNSVVTTKYSRTQTAEPEGMGYPKGTVTYAYKLSDNDANAVIIYHVRLGESDQSQYIKEAIDTLKFL